MALDNIRQANKKARREAKRKQIRDKISGSRQMNKVRRLRTRKMFLQGQREFNAKRKAEKSYIEQLTSEVENE